MEIHLRETADLVDHFFLVEATITHKGENKPILWERLRYFPFDSQSTICLDHRFTERFSFLKEEQVIHVVVDQLGDNETHRSKAAEGGTDWWVFILLTLSGGFLLSRWFEQQQTLAGVKRVKDWAAAKKNGLEDSDIFISGNADEVKNISKATYLSLVTCHCIVRFSADLRCTAWRTVSYPAI